VSAVVARDLTKRYDAVVALDAVSFEVAPGELFGFIGPDGAGKTTLFRLLVTLLIPTAGSATVLGDDVVRDIWKLRRRIGYMPGRFSLYPDLSVEENLRFFASVFGTTIEREYERIAPIYSQIEPFKDRRASRCRVPSCIGRTSCFSTSPRLASTRCPAASSGICSIA
jgi:ABC-2 type transport system ATP-binding protein